MTPMGTPDIEVRGVTKTYGSAAPAVDDVSFAVAAGEMLALIGPNGAGKSTCFNMVGGQLRPDAGTVRLGGQAITGMRPRAIWRLGVGRTFQVTATFASMTVRENVQVALISAARRPFDAWRPARARYAPPAAARPCWRRPVAAGCRSPRSDTWNRSTRP